MLSNVLKSLVARAEIYDPETGEPKHPLLAQREEKNILLIVVTGDKGLAGAFNANITKAAARFLESKAGKNVDIEAVGRKGRDFLRRRYPAAAVQTPSLAESEEPLEAPHEAAERLAAPPIKGGHSCVFRTRGFGQTKLLATNV